MDGIMLKIDNISKKYILGQIGSTTLRDELQRKKAKFKGEDDPTKKIGINNENHKEFYALNGVSFEVKKGERVGIIGHNGAGKSTLLKLISRVTAPTSGTIYMNGRVASMLEVGTGFNPELTGRENIYMNGAILGMTKKEIDSKIEDIIEFSECREFIDTPVKRYSSGMYVKLAFSVAAHLDSEILIMDEVLAVGDMAFQKKCLDKMNVVSKSEGRTILYVSHNMNTIRQLCDRTIVLNHGNVIFDGNVEDGIGKYIGLVEKCETHYVYNESQRKVVFFGKEVELLGLDILDRNEAVIKRGQNLKCNIHCRFNKKCNGARIRFEIHSKGELIGSYLMSDTFDGDVNEETNVIFYVSTKNLTPSKYNTTIITYERDEVGNQVLLDRVEDGLIFEVINDENDDVWFEEYWGKIRFDDLKIIENRKEIDLNN